MNEIQDTHPSFFRENIARIANAAPSLLIKVAMNFIIVVLNFQRCDQCPKDHKSLGSLTLSGCSLSVIVIIASLSSMLSLSLLSSLSFCWSCHVSSQNAFHFHCLCLQDDEEDEDEESYLARLK